MTHGLVHYHFGNRDRMLAETIRWVVENTVVDMGLVSEGGDVDGFAIGLAELAEHDREAHLFANEVVLAAARRPDLRALVEPMYDGIFSAITRTLKAAGIPASLTLTRLVFAAVHGLTIPTSPLRRAG